MNSRILVSAASLLLLGGAWLAVFGRDDGAEAAPSPRVVAERMVPPRAVARVPSTESPARKAAMAGWDLPKAGVSPFDDESEDHAAWIRERVAELEDLSWYFDEPEVLRKVMADLRSPEPELRHAARAAVLNLGSREAIPYLESGAALTDVPSEKLALLEAADYLKLPTVLEVGER